MSHATAMSKSRHNKKQSVTQTLQDDTKTSEETTTNRSKKRGKEVSIMSPFPMKYLHFILPISVVFVSIILQYRYNSTFIPIKKGVQNEIYAEENTPTCRRYLAKSVIPNAGMGIFTAEDIPEGSPINVDGDIVLHLTDLNPHTAQSLRMMIYDYAWDSQDFLGMYEGKNVYSIVPGYGMLTNGHQTLFNTDQSLYPSVDNAGVSRMNNPGAGAFSHYYNYSFVASKAIAAGQELLMNYGQEWFDERDKIQRIVASEPVEQVPLARSVDWLRKHGICLDNLEVRKSTIAMAGRGAFATRNFTKGSVVAPVPVIPLDRRSLTFYRVKETSDGTEEVETLQQLFLNYCYGHKFSSILLFPYGPGINFVNHNSSLANIQLRWSESSQHRLSSVENISIEELRRMDTSGLMLDAIALRDIHESEEIFLDYGKEWENLFTKHVRAWYPQMNGTEFKYANELDSSEKNIKTIQEQQTSPYHPSIFTSCFYIYSNAISTGDERHVWVEHKNIFHSEHLRPCVILHRSEVRNGSDAFYTVAIMNRFGLVEKEMVPKGEQHIVIKLPRRAIRFSSKVFTTDQHISSAFRSPILPMDGIFPSQWLDLNPI